MSTIYEGSVLLRVDRELNDDEQRIFGDALDEAESLIAGALVEKGLEVDFSVETHGPVALIT